MSLCVGLTICAATLFSLGLFSEREASAPTESVQRIYNKKMNLIVAIKNRDNAPIGYALLGMNSEKGRFAVAFIPTATVLDDRPLSDIYKNEGIEGLSRRVEDFFGIPIDRYLDAPEQVFADITDLLGGAMAELSYELSQADPQRDVYVKIGQGRQLLGGTRLCDLFYYSLWRGGLVEQCTVVSRALCDCIMRPSVSDNAMSAVDSAVKKAFSADTDITYNDYLSVRDDIGYIINNGTAEAVVLSGRTRLSGAEFYPSDTALALIKVSFGYET